ncbi:MAG: hypothetical protein ACP5UA_08480 [Candidatus Hydrogenedens sp.]
MFLSCVDRIKAEVITSKIKISWSVISGTLESIKSLPDNFEWVGKSEINISFLKENGEKINYEITDLDFSEDYDEKSYGILQILYFEQNRLKIRYYGLNNFPALFIKGEFLTNNPLSEDVELVPFYFNFNKEIKNIEIKEIGINNKELSYIQTDKRNTLLFYNEYGMDLDIRYLNTMGIHSLYMKIQKKDNCKSKPIMKLPQIYICPLDCYDENEILTLHYKIIDTHKKYEKWVQEQK